MPPLTLCKRSRHETYSGYKFMSNGKVFLVGAGPGLPSLITLRGKELLDRAEALVYDALASVDFLNWVPASCEKIYVGKRAGNHALSQEEINALLVELGQKGKTVVRLKGGDPYVFGRGGEEAEALAQAGIDFEVVPGVTSAIGGLSYAGIPITDRSCAAQFTVLTGHENPEKKESSLNYTQLANTPGTKVILMGMSSLPYITEQLLSHGMAPTTPAAIVQWAGTERQKTVVGTLKTIAAQSEKAGLSAPALIVFGEVVEKRETLNWFEKLPLFGKRIVVTRTREQAGELSKRLRELGAEVFELPTIRIEHPTNKLEFAESVVSCHTYDWLVFSSPNGVERFFQAFFSVYSDLRCIGGCRIAAIGSATAAKIKARGLAVDVMPDKAVAEELVKAFKKRNKEEDTTIENQTFLWVHGEQARDVISKGLTEMGAIVDDCLAYRTVPETDDPTGIISLWDRVQPDVVTFTSSSTAENFLALGLPLPDGCKAASIGPVTSATLVKAGLKPAITAKSHDIPGLVDALVAALSKKR